MEAVATQAARGSLAVAPGPAPIGAATLRHVPFQEAPESALDVGLRLRDIFFQLGLEMLTDDPEHISLFLVRHIVHLPANRDCERARGPDVPLNGVRCAPFSDTPSRPSGLLPADDGM